MKYVFALFIFALTLLLSSCGPGRDLSKYIYQNKTAFNNLTGGQDFTGNNFTGFSPPLEQSKMKDQIPETEDNKTFALNLEEASAIIDKQDLKVTVKWRHVEKPLEFQGKLLPKGKNEFAGNLQDTTNQRTDLKMIATCSDATCEAISAFIEDQSGHKVGFIIRQEEREIDVKLSEDKLKSLSTQKQDIFAALKKNNKVKVTSTEIFPGRSTYKINSPLIEGLIQGDLTETNNGAVKAQTQGKFSEIGNVSLVGNTNSGELVLKVSNDIDVQVKKEEPGWLKKLFSNENKKVETTKETVSAYVFLKPRPQQTEIPEEKPPQEVSTSIPKENKNQETKKSVVIVADPPIIPTQSHELVKQILADSNRKELQPYIKTWLQGNADQISVSDLKNNGKLFRFLFLHEKLSLPFKINGADDIKKMVKTLRENNLPAAISMLSYVESGFYPSATSPKQAQGWWQFMTPTAQQYGLVSWEDSIRRYDLRNDVTASTRAAANYLKDLLKFWDGDIKMTLASYNAGHGTMSFQTDKTRYIKKELERKLRRDNVPLAEIADYTKDFWVLSYYNSIPKETRDHVPKILSGVIISMDPKKFNIDSLPLEAY